MAGILTSRTGLKQLLSALMVGTALPMAAGMPPAFAQNGTAESDRLEIEADSASYDSDNSTYTAEGNVLIQYRGREVRADRVVYNQDSGEVHATGDVVLTDPSGAVFAAEDVQLTDDLASGVIKGLHGILDDGSQLAAAEAQRTGGDRSVLRYAVYSPCQICDGDSPLWQIKAKQVIHDETEGTLRYKDAVMEVKGVPIFYLPYFSHPDSTVDRRTGFLTPSLSTDSELGFGIEFPFFWAPSDTRDFTFTPKFTTNEGVILFSQYRENVGIGTHQFDGSVTYPKERDSDNNLTGDREWRGHVFGSGRYDLGRSWDSGFDVALASDDTYLRRYDISRAYSLTNNIFVNKRTPHTFFAINTYAFQGLRQEDVQDRIPIILPIIDYQYRAAPGWLDSRWTADGNFLALHRIEGRDMYRMSGSGSWELPYTNDLGQVFRLTAAMRGDLYLIHDPEDSQKTEAKGRAAPTAAVDWRWPFARSSENAQHIIEPLVSLVATPNESSDDIPNEDSINVEFSDINLFRHNRSPGYDIREGGVRANYGMRYSVIGHSGIEGSVLVGQSWRLTGQSPFPKNTGLGDERSDIVTGVDLSIPGWLNLHHSMRLNETNLSVKRNQLELFAGPPDARLRVGYLDATAQGFDTSLPDREEINLGGYLRLSEQWSTNGNLVHSFDDRVGTIQWAFGVTYEGSCIRLETTLQRSNAEDRDIRPTTTLYFKIALTNLGG